MWRITALLSRDRRTDRAKFNETIRGPLADSLARILRGRPGVTRASFGLAPVDPEVTGVFPTSHDAILEIWCRTADAAIDAAKSVAADESVAQMVAGILEGESGVAWLGEVCPQKPDGEGRTRVKFLAAGDVAEGFTVEDAQRYWKDEHPRVARSVPSVWDRLTLYTQFHARKGIAIDIGPHIALSRFVPMASDIGFAQAQDFVALYSDPGYLRVVRPDEQKFSRPEEMLAFVTDKENVILTG